MPNSFILIKTFSISFSLSDHDWLQESEWQLGHPQAVIVGVSSVYMWYQWRLVYTFQWTASFKFVSSVWPPLSVSVSCFIHIFYLRSVLKQQSDGYAEVCETSVNDMTYKPCTHTNTHRNTCSKFIINVMLPTDKPSNGDNYGNTDNKTD